IGDDAGALERAGRTLLRRTGMKAVLVTRGSRGMALFEPKRPTAHIPTFGSAAVTDVTRAGDTVMAAVALALAPRAPLYEGAARQPPRRSGRDEARPRAGAGAGAVRRRRERSRRAAGELVAGRTAAGTTVRCVGAGACVGRGGHTGPLLPRRCVGADPCVGPR